MEKTSYIDWIDWKIKQFYSVSSINHIFKGRKETIVLLHTVSRCPNGNVFLLYFITTRGRFSGRSHPVLIFFLAFSRFTAVKLHGSAKRERANYYSKLSGAKHLEYVIHMAILRHDFLCKTIYEIPSLRSWKFDR